MKLIDDYTSSLRAIYDHVGFTEDWVICPLDDKTDMYWDVVDDIILYGEQEFSVGTYEDEIYTQRFYQKYIYEGQDITLIFCDPHVDGMQWFRLFDNKKRVDSQKNYITHNDDETISSMGTSLTAYIHCSYQEIVERFGEPDTADQYKVDAQWVMKFKDGTIATIYNCKDGIPIKDIKEWHIGSVDDKAIFHIKELFPNNTIEDMKTYHNRILTKWESIGS